MPLLLPTLSFLGYCLALGVWTKRDPDEWSPVVASATVLTLLAAALGGFLARATSLLVMGGLLSIAVLAVILVRRRQPPPLPIGLLTFALASLALTLMCDSAAYWDWDEFSHWGLASKEICQRHTLWGADSPVHFRSYPPGTALFHYFMLWPGTFSEGGTYAAHAMLMLAFLVPLMRRPADAAPVGIPFLLRVVAIVTFAFSGLHLFAGGVFSLYADGAMGLILGAALADYARDEGRSVGSLIRVAAALALLPLLKPAGVGLALIGALVVVVDLAATGRRVHGIAIGVIAGMLVLVPLSGSALWNGWVRAHHAPARAISGDEAGLDPDVSAALSQADRQAVGLEFAHALACRRVGTLDPVIAAAGLRRAGIHVPPLPPWSMLSPFAWAAILTATAACGAAAARGRLDAPRNRRLHFALLMGFAFWLAGMLSAYLSGFRPHEAVRLASFGRYAGTYVLAWFIAAGLPLIALPSHSRGYRQATLALAISAAIAGLAIETTVSPAFPPLLSQRRERLQTIARAVSIKTAPDSRIFHVAQNSDGFDHMVMRYELSPRLTQYWGWTLGSADRECDGWSPLTADGWAAVLARYDHVLLGSVRESFQARYGALFDNPADIQTHRLFRVVHGTAGTVRLVAAD